MTKIEFDILLSAYLLESYGHLLIPIARASQVGRLVMDGYLDYERHNTSCYKFTITSGGKQFISDHFPEINQRFEKLNA